MYTFPEDYEEYKTMPPGTTYDVTVDLADWYDLSQPDRYTVTARWCCRMQSEPHERAAEPIVIEVIREEGADSHLSDPAEPRT